MVWLEVGDRRVCRRLQWHRWNTMQPMLRYQDVKAAEVPSKEGWRSDPA